MSYLKTWLYCDSNRKNIPMDELYVTMNEVDSNIVAIKAGNVFSISYSLLANVSETKMLIYMDCLMAEALILIFALFWGYRFLVLQLPSL